MRNRLKLRLSLELGSSLLPGCTFREVEVTQHNPESVLQFLELSGLFLDPFLLLRLGLLEQRVVRQFDVAGVEGCAALVLANNRREIFEGSGGL